jgi:hypothetical protein
MDKYRLTVRLSHKARILLAREAKRLGLSLTATVELAIRKLAKAKGVL